MSERDPDFERLLEFIREERAFDFTGYKRPSLMRRIVKRMHERGIQTFAAYQELLDAEPEEFVPLFDTILINVTSFFRDDGSWDYLASEIVPPIVESGHDIRVWSTGCATGEEAYTAAILFAEALGDDAFRRRVKIYATDIDDDALNIGRHARYTPKQVESVPPELRRRYFEEGGTSYSFRQDLRRCVIFGRHDVIQDPPISKIDLLISRNTLMYFTTEAQEQILQNFHFALRDEGYLFLGKAEALAARSALFTPLDLKRRVFARVGRHRLVVLPPDRDNSATLEPELESGVRALAIDAAPVAQIVVDADGSLVLANAHSRVLFGIKSSDLGRPFQDLEVSYRPVELRSRIQKAYAERHPVWVQDVEWSSEGEMRVMDVQVAPLTSPTGDTIGASITFADVTRFNRLREEAAISKRALETAYEELQSTVEELETTNEELSSTNEELETTNEELQSTNEELETMNEELQSTNEELETTNDELQQRTDELNAVNLFLESVLGSLRAAVVVLDKDLQITGWNDAAFELWGLRPDEVLGKHLMNLDIGLPVGRLHGPVRQVFAGDGQPEIELHAVNRRGRRVTCRVELVPLDGGGGVRGAILMMHPHDEEPA
jgi:two-component system, chemotaxis family, CheB/CheR fusion protein